MPFETEVDALAQLFEVRYYGSVTVAEREEAVDRVFAVAKLTGFRRVLVDFRSAQCVVDSFEPSNRLAARLAEETVDKGGRIAYVAHRSSQVDQILETLAEDRRVPFKRFTDAEAAKAWLVTDAANPRDG